MNNDQLTMNNDQLTMNNQPPAQSGWTRNE
jgi:hypothetical protein